MLFPFPQHVIYLKMLSKIRTKRHTLSKYRKSIKAWEFGYGNAIFEIFKKKTYGKEVLLDGV